MKIFDFFHLWAKMKKRRKPLILLGFPAEFLAFPRWFEHPAFRLGGRTYPLEGVCNIRFLHKIRIFRDFRVKNKLFSVTFADFTVSPERVAPRRVPKMAPFIQSGTKLLFRRRVARVFFLFLRSKYNKSKVIFKMSARKWICFQNCIDYSTYFGYNR